MYSARACVGGGKNSAEADVTEEAHTPIPLLDLILPPRLRQLEVVTLPGSSSP